jgi:hypothetical protein
VDYGSFLNHKLENDNKREIATFLAHMTQETSVGTTDHMPSRLEMGLYWNEEIVHINPDYPPDYIQEPTESIPLSLYYPPTPGKSYHGRGAFQLSWNYNYGLFSDIFFLDSKILLDKPELLIQDGVLGWMAAIAFYMTPQLPKASMHQVIDSDFVFSNPQDAARFIPGFGLTIIIMNGGLESGFKEGELVEGPNGLIVQGGDERVWTRINMYKRITTINGANIEGEKIDTFGLESWS